MRCRGFTLLELSIVLVIIAVVVGGGLTIFTNSLQASQFNVTVARMDAIESALANYAYANGRIPCPSDLLQPLSSATYGVEAGAGAGSSPGNATGVCVGASMVPQATFSTSSTSVAEGGIPVRALGLSDDYMYDGWGRRLRYAVDPSMTVAGSFPVSVTGTCSPSTITIQDASHTARTAAAVYAIISHGSSGHGGYTSNSALVNTGNSSVDKLTNCHCNNSGATTAYAPTYVQKAPQYDSAQAGNPIYYFDDIVAYKEAWQMVTPTIPTKQTGVPAGAASLYYYTGGPAGVGSVLFQNTGGVFSMLPIANQSPFAVYPGGGTQYLSWSPDNKYLFITNGYAATGQFMVYSVTGQTTTQIPNALSGLPPPNTYFVPSNGGWSPDNFYVATSSNAYVSGAIAIYKRCKNSFNMLPNTPNAWPWTPGGYTYTLTWTPDSRFLMPQSPNSWINTSTGLFLRGPNDTFSFVPITTLFPGGLQYGGNVVFSNDGKYAIELGQSASSPTAVYVYIKSGTVYNFLTTFSIPMNPTNTISYAFSPDTNYIAFHELGATPYIYVATRSGNTFLPSPGVLNSPANTSGQGLLGDPPSWSPDSQYLATSGYCYAGNGSGIAIYKVNGGAFTLLPPMAAPPGTCDPLQDNCYGHTFGIHFSN